MYTLTNYNFRWSASSIKIILVHKFNGLNLLKTKTWLNQETKVNVHTARSCRLVTDKPNHVIDFDQLRARIFYSERTMLTKFYYIDMNVLPKNRQLAFPIRTYIRDTSEIFSISSLVKISLCFSFVFRPFFFIFETLISM